MNFFFGPQPSAYCTKCGGIVFKVFFPKDVSTKRIIALECVGCHETCDLESFDQIESVVGGMKR